MQLRLFCLFCTKRVICRPDYAAAELQACCSPDAAENSARSNQKEILHTIGRSPAAQGRHGKCPCCAWRRRGSDGGGGVNCAVPASSSPCSSLAERRLAPLPTSKQQLHSISRRMLGRIMRGGMKSGGRFWTSANAFASGVQRYSASCKQQRTCSSLGTMLWT